LPRSLGSCPRSSTNGAPTLASRRVSLFRRPEASEVLLLELFEGPDVTTEFRKVAARETVHDRVLHQLRHDRSERVRRTAERRQADP